MTEVVPLCKHGSVSIHGKAFNASSDTMNIIRINFLFWNFIDTQAPVNHSQTELHYQVSRCSLIPPATAISKTQDRGDTSVWGEIAIFNFLHNLLCSKPNN